MAITRRNHHAKLVGEGISQITIRVICSLFNIGALTAASIAIAAINEVAEFYNENGAEYENVGSYRAAAGWLIFAASSTIIFHVIAVIFHLLYMSSTVKKHIKLFMAANGIACVLFTLAFLAGGILNAIYASENGDLRFDLCFGVNTVDDEFCHHLERVITAETASAVLSFFSMMFFAVLVCCTFCTYIGPTSTSNSYYARPQVVDPPRQLTNMSAYPLPNAPQYVSPPGPSYPSGLSYPSAYTSQYPSPSAPPYPPTQHVSPSAPYNLTAHQPSHISPSAPLKPEDNALSDLPSYETAIAEHYIVPQPVPSGEPAEESKIAPVP